MTRPRAAKSQAKRSAIPDPVGRWMARAYYCNSIFINDLITSSHVRDEGWVVDLVKPFWIVGIRLGPPERLDPVEFLACQLQRLARRYALCRSSRQTDGLRFSQCGRE